MLFDNFNFKILEDPEYKEDAVREDIIAPLLKYIGFSSDKDPRIIRGSYKKRFTCSAEEFRQYNYPGNRGVHYPVLHR